MATLVRERSAAGLLASLLLLGITLGGGAAAQAAPQYDYGCDYCHRMPPLDSATVTNNSDSGAVPGNHQGHASSRVESCTKCHGDQARGYLTGHSNGTVELSDDLGYSRKPAGGFLNQTSVPPIPLGNCSAASCHSDGKGHLRPTPPWASSPFRAPADCTRCHDAAPQTGNHPIPGSKHATYFGTDTGSCLKCHPDHLAEPGPFRHASSVGGRATVVRFADGGSFSAGSCSGVYCHSNGRGVFAAPAWGGTLGCTGCHGSATDGGAAPLSGKHQRHVNNAGFLGTDYGCIECHAATVGSNETIADRTRHVNGSIDIAGPRVGSPRAGTCDTTYCHSDGKGGQKTVSWTQVQGLDCTGCHGSDSAPAFASRAGEPNYPNAGAGKLLANSHGAHVLVPADCATCHAATVDGSGKLAGAAHTDGLIQVAFNAALAGPGAAWDSSTRSCSAVYCHSDGTSVGTGAVAGGNMAWGGGSLACDGCHGFPPSYANGSPKANSHAAHSFGCNACHAGTTADGSRITGPYHGNRAYDLAPGAGVSFSYLFAPTGGTCSNISCHNGGTAVWGATLTCGDCHTDSPGGD